MAQEIRSTDDFYRLDLGTKLRINWLSYPRHGQVVEADPDPDGYRSRLYLSLVGPDGPFVMSTDIFGQGGSFAVV